MNQNNFEEIAGFSSKSLQSPNCWVGHLPFAYWVIKKVSPKIFVELGTHTGNSYFSFCQSVDEAGLPTKCHAVDTWQGDEQTGYYNEEVFSKVYSHNQKHYSKFSRLLRTTFDKAVNYFDDESIGLLHIDGLHTYDAVRHDFETWLPKLTPGAIVMLHDTAIYKPNFEVHKLWCELQARYPNNLEFKHSNGLGVLQLNKAPDDKVLEWLLPKSKKKQRLINYFSALGSHQLKRFELNELKNEITRLKNENTSLSKVLSKRDEEIMVRDHQYSSMLASKSWRITAPLRYVGQLTRRIIYLLRAILSFIHRKGGTIAIAQKVLSVYRHEGLFGIKRALQRVLSDRNDYAKWIRLYDTLTDEVCDIMRTKLENMTLKPMISVIMPTYNTKPEWLIEAIESVRKQIYPYWELCVADDASSDAKVRLILERYAKEDSRIKIVFRNKNGHISAASNCALELATGEWVALLDHDDKLLQHTLFWVADAINQNPNAQLIYSDEDKIDEDGIRFGPYFKCDWNVDLFYSHNLITHLGVYRTELLRKIGGFRLGFEGAQDYDLALRCIEHINSKEIHHIPRVLYHWRCHKESTASSSNAKPYAMLAGERALNEHFQRKNVKAKAKYINHGYRVRYALPKTLPLVSLIIPTKNGLTLIQKCIESILEKTTYTNFEIIIVDNGSDDPEVLSYLESLKLKHQVLVLRDDRPFNFSALNNTAVKIARGEIVGLLNNDTEVIKPNWLSDMVSLAIQPGVGAVGARLWYPRQTLQHGGVILGVGGVAGHSHRHLPRYQLGYSGRASLIQSVSVVTAACLVIRKAIYEEIGGLNEIDTQISLNDVDFCLRVREAGYRNIWTPYAELYHHESKTRGYDDTPEKRAIFSKERDYMKERWGVLLFNDPAYNPNLTLEYEDFSLAWPPRVELLFKLRRTQ